MNSSYTMGMNNIDGSGATGRNLEWSGSDSIDSVSAHMSSNAEREVPFRRKILPVNVDSFIFKKFEHFPVGISAGIFGFSSDVSYAVLC